MTGLHRTTYSPSSSSSRRSTPCVEGCCGPMLMIIVSWRISPEAPTSRGPGLILAHGHVVVRRSTGGMNAPWNRVSTPPSSSVFSSGCPSHPSGIRIRVRPGCPSNTTP